jgi:hypothetical protein
MPFAKREGTDRNVREPYTEEEILKAIDMKYRLKLTWPMIADRLGRSPASLAVYTSQYRKGKLTFGRHKSRLIYEEVAQALIDGAKMQDCVVQFGVKRTTLVMGLRRYGWDQETIEEARQYRKAA